MRRGGVGRRLGSETITMMDAAATEATADYAPRPPFLVEPPLHIIVIPRDNDEDDEECGGADKRSDNFQGRKELFSCIWAMAVCEA